MKPKLTGQNDYRSIPTFERKRSRHVSNQMAQEGYELVTFSTMPSAKGILVFKESGTADDAVDNEADAE